MNHKPLTLSLLSCSALLATPLSAENASPGGLQPPVSPTLNRFSLGYRMGINVDTKFRKFGSFTGLSARNNLDGDPYNYDNGYVYPDDGTVNSGLTHYWGYDGFDYGGGNQLPGNGTILMQRASSDGFSAGDHGDQFEGGFELTWNRELGRNAKQNLRWGVESAFNYMVISVNENSSLTGSANLLTDAYPLQVDDDLMPPAGYQGRRDTPGIVIGANAERSNSQIVETVSGSRRFDADLFGFRVGPYLEVPLNQRVSFSMSGGLAFMIVDSRFRFTESITAGSVEFAQSHGSSSHCGAVVGGYVSGNFSYAFNESMGAFVGAQFQDVGEYHHRVNGRSAVIDLSHSVFVNFGVNFTF